MDMINVEFLNYGGGCGRQVVNCRINGEHHTLDLDELVKKYHGIEFFEKTRDDCYLFNAQVMSGIEDAIREHYTSCEFVPHKQEYPFFKDFEYAHYFVEEYSQFIFGSDAQRDIQEWYKD